MLHHLLIHIPLSHWGYSFPRGLNNMLERVGRINRLRHLEMMMTGLEDRMVQVASMSFMAPKMQLRVVNPDQESLNSFGDEASFRRRISAGRQV